MKIYKQYAWEDMGYVLSLSYTCYIGDQDLFVVASIWTDGTIYELRFYKEGYKTLDYVRGSYQEMYQYIKEHYNISLYSWKNRSLPKWPIDGTRPYGQYTVKGQKYIIGIGDFVTYGFPNGPITQRVISVDNEFNDTPKTIWLKGPYVQFNKNDSISNPQKYRDYVTRGWLSKSFSYDEKEHIAQVTCPSLEYDSSRYIFTTNPKEIEVFYVNHPDWLRFYIECFVNSINRHYTPGDGWSPKEENIILKHIKYAQLKLDANDTFLHTIWEIAEK